ncbi:hypothetical protein B1A99_03200 [Cohnella sp. CIP 111063]|jgi:capsular polysaccharide biosynthesis protein|uniref:YveK family protein n=1 Tax=unclassified Cohnella TaxID=2636738 RepID=UPI000B8C4DA4|nr:MULTISPECIES: Wzz/FepE/Etk N-terminal domain-containing protein [unclassified Cohnella]OXS61638.1 hypothetical protein B1A99_03200 [Cohnella sp. CIP 111063]PRX74056.1 capsular polysaccharide biosynthesis protein [Cohnella sp. SGD-V74]
MELGVKDYFRVMIKRWWIIATIVVIVCGLTAGYGRYFSDPVYETNSKLIVISSKTEMNVGRLDSNEISTNIMLVETYKEIITSPAILEKVITQYPEIQMDLNQLISNIKVASSSGSQVMNISIRSTNLDQAVIAVNAVAEVFKEEIPKIMNVDNITILSQAKASDHRTPVSYSIFITTMIAFVLSLFFSVGFVFLLEYLDNTLKSERDVEMYLGIPTLTILGRIKTTKVAKNAGAKNKSVIGESIHVSAHQ